jgi:hypothetical protein
MKNSTDVVFYGPVIRSKKKYFAWGYVVKKLFFSENTWRILPDRGFPPIIYCKNNLTG